MEWSDGSIAAKRWWLHICNRIDGIDEQATTSTKNNLWLTDGDTSKNLVFSRSKIGSHYIWIEKFVVFDPYVSETFKREMEAAGVTGPGFKPCPETD